MRTIHIETRGKGLVIALLVLAVSGSAQPPSVPDYSQQFPVYELARRLEARYGVPVTTEEPLLVWRGELRSMGLTPKGTEKLIPRPYDFVLPKEDPVLNAPAISAEVVQQGLAVYHRQNPGRARYQVIKSAMGFHIVPASALDASGTLHPVKSLLDTPVEIVSEMRTATEHVEAVLKAISQATGVHFREVRSFDPRYAANGYFLRSGLPAAEDRPYWLFQWGAEGMSAREALVSLLKGSATTMTWSLVCGLDASRENQQTCDFQVLPMAVGDARTDLYLDRCSKCRPIPK